MVMGSEDKRRGALLSDAMSPGRTCFVLSKAAKQQSSKARLVGEKEKSSHTNGVLQRCKRRERRDAPMHQAIQHCSPLPRTPPAYLGTRATRPGPVTSLTKSETIDPSLVVICLSRRNLASH